MVEKMKKTKVRVRKLLVEKPYLRDDDNKLISYILMEDAGGIEALRSMSALDFLTTFSKGKFTSPESVRRMRAKLQEQEVELRGELYNKRKGDGDNMRDDMNNL